MSRAASGTVFYEGGRWRVRYSLPSGKRPVVSLPDTIAENDRATAEQLGKAVSDAARSAALPEPAQTYRQWTALWLAERTRRGLTSEIETSAKLRTYVFPIIGDIPMIDVRREHIAAVVKMLDDKILDGSLAWKSAAICYSVVTTSFGDACSSKDDLVRILRDNPCSGVRGPETGASRTKQYLLPSEFMKFVSSNEIPLRWRRLLAVAVYSGLRAGELEALDYTDINLEGGFIHVHRSCERHQSRGKIGALKVPKSNKARKVPIEPNLRPLLEKMISECVASGRPRLLKVPGASTAALMLRRFLKRAGVDRPELFATSKLTRRINFHDARASNLTWLAIQGVDAMKIAARAGHASLSTTAVYVRETEMLDKAALKVFPKLPPELYE